MVVPPEVFSGVSWPLTYSEADVEALERASYLDNLKPRDELIRKSSVFTFMGGEDSPYTQDDMQALRHMTIQRPAARQVVASLEAITRSGEEICREIVISGLANYVEQRNATQSAGFYLRPNTELQRKTVLSIPYEELDSLESFFDAVSLLVREGTTKLVDETATSTGLSVPEIDQQLQLIKEKQGTDWFSSWKTFGNNPNYFPV